MTARQQRNIGVAIIRNSDHQILIDKRLPKGSFAGFWEFPGGKIEPGESVTDCIVREIQEEIGIQVQVREQLIEIHHDYPQFTVNLAAYWCDHVAGEPQALECEEVRWVTIAELSHYQFPEANQEIIDAIQNQK